MKFTLRASLVYNFALFPLSFAGAGLGNVVPQLQLARTHAGSKESLLAACLLGGSLASLAGVWLGRKARPAGRAGAWMAGLALFLAVAATGALARVDTAIAFLGGYFVLRLGLNALTQAADRRIVQVVSAEERRASDVANTVFRFAGMMLGSVLFALLFDAPSRLAAILGVLAAAGAGAVALAVGAREHAEKPGEDAGEVPATVAEWTVLASGALAYATLYLFAANLTYLLAEVHHVTAPGRMTGLLLLIVYGASIAGAALVPRLRRVLGPSAHRLDLRLVVPAAAIIGVGALLSGLPAAGQPAIFGVISAAIGVAHALFLLESREFVTRLATREGKGGLLAGFNNLGNLGALVGFGLMALLAQAVPRESGYYRALLVLVAALSLASGLVAAWAVRRMPAEKR